MQPKPKHTYSSEWGSPKKFADFARKTMGRIDLDPASNPIWNDVVQATTFFDKQADGLKQSWKTNTKGTMVFVNPPGDKTGALIKKFWRKLVESYDNGDITAAVWVGFNLSQLVSLQRAAKNGAHPLHFPCIIPAQRIKFLHLNKRGKRRVSTRPGHGNYIVLLPPKNAQLAKKMLKRWRQYGADIGAVIAHSEGETND